MYRTAAIIWIITITQDKSEIGMHGQSGNENTAFETQLAPNYVYITVTIISGWLHARATSLHIGNYPIIVQQYTKGQLSTTELTEHFKRKRTIQ